MTQLTYNEAFDPYNAIFRIIRLNDACLFSEKTSFDMLRILDFYLLFPFRIQGISLYAEDVSWRSISRSYEWMVPYGGMPDDRVIFDRMEPFQRAAVSSLAKAGHVSTEEWALDEVLFLKDSMPDTMTTRVRTSNHQMADIIEILCSMRERYPLLGKKGLKARSKLMEFRYDPV
ncbi:ABC-three component system middle component 5 [Sulfitobacter pontiacus]|nr:ABC-three component system middle component 5 [Sulfitobacter pontiacus]